MNKRLLIWGIPAAIYVTFFVWYTNFSGPLDPEEIAHFMELIEAREDSPERLERIRRFMEEDQGDDFLMLNALDMRDQPERVGEVGPDETSEEVMGRYMEYMFPALISRACHPTVYGQAVAPAMDLLGIEGAEQWTAGALMRYRSRRDMLEIASNPAFQGRHIYKLAALDKTIAYPIETQINLGEPRILVALLLLVIAMGTHIVTSRSASS